MWRISAYLCCFAVAGLLALAGCKKPPEAGTTQWPASEDWKLPPEKHPLCKDRTGLVWTVPFAKARRKAEDEERLLVIKPSDFGAFKDGDW